jgi:hypothetical protein
MNVNAGHDRVQAEIRDDADPGGVPDIRQQNVICEPGHHSRQGQGSERQCALSPFVLLIATVTRAAHHEDPGRQNGEEPRHLDDRFKRPRSPQVHQVDPLDDQRHARKALR